MGRWLLKWMVWWQGLCKLWGAFCSGIAAAHMKILCTQPEIVILPVKVALIVVLLLSVTCLVTSQKKGTVQCTCGFLLTVLFHRLLFNQACLVCFLKAHQRCSMQKFWSTFGKHTKNLLTEVYGKVRITHMKIMGTLCCTRAAAKPLHGSVKAPNLMTSCKMFIDAWLSQC